MSNYKTIPTKIFKADYDLVKERGLNMSMIIKQAVATAAQTPSTDLMNEGLVPVDQAELVQIAFYGGKNAGKLQEIIDMHSTNAFIPRQRVVQILLHRFIQKHINNV